MVGFLFQRYLNHLDLGQGAPRRGAGPGLAGSARSSGFWPRLWLCPQSIWRRENRVPAGVPTPSVAMGKAQFPGPCPYSTWRLSGETIFGLR